MTRFNAHQNELLFKFILNNPKSSKHEKKSLAKSLNLTYDQVRFWIYRIKDRAKLGGINSTMTGTKI